MPGNGRARGFVSAEKDDEILATAIARNELIREQLRQQELRLAEEQGSSKKKQKS